MWLFISKNVYLHISFQAVCYFDSWHKTENRNFYYKRLRPVSTFLEVSFVPAVPGPVYTWLWLFNHTWHHLMPLC